MSSPPSPPSRQEEDDDKSFQDSGSPMKFDDDETALLLFHPGQKVWAREAPGAGVFYEAIIRKTIFTTEDYKYYVHYQGWNARWDKWLGKDDLLPDTEETRQRIRAEQQKQQDEIKQPESSTTTTDATAATDTTTVPSSSSRKRKKSKEPKTTSNKRRSSSKAATTTVAPSLEAYCELPFTLKTILMDDRERIVQVSGEQQAQSNKWRPTRLVHNLPASITVRKVLDHYVTWKTKKDASLESAARMFATDVAALFDAALPACLLYQPERAQYLSTVVVGGGSSSPCDVYGCEHLLRLFVRLPTIMKHQQQQQHLGPQLAELIVLLQKNRQACFKAKYREPSQEELAKWEKALQQENENAPPVGMDE